MGEAEQHKTSREGGGMPPLFDTHCHCGLFIDGNSPAQPGEYELIATAEIHHWPQLLTQLDARRQRFGAVGLHPWYAAQWGPSCVDQLEELLVHPAIIAMGEVGIDPTAAVDMEVQEQVLRTQIRVALKADKPLILHVYKGYNDILRILQDEGAGHVGGVMHGFSAGANIGHAFIRLGFYLGIGPLLLRNNVRKLPEALSHIPLEHLVLETDAQGGMKGYATPEERTAVLHSIARRLAEMYAISTAEVQCQLWHNSSKMLRLDQDLFEKVRQN